VTERDVERLVEAGVYDPHAADAAEQRRLLEQLVAEGLTVDDLLASRLGDIVLRAFERLILPGERATVGEVADRIGLAADQVRELRRAWGLADAPAGERIVTPAEVRALQFAAAVAGLLGSEQALHVARVMGTAMSRIAEAEIALVRSWLEAPMYGRGESAASVLRAYANVIERVLPGVLETLDALHRAHLVAIGRRYSSRALPPSETNVVDLVVGFADLSHSTTLVQHLDLAGLDRALTAFDAVTSDAIAAAGATVVKRLGDGVMFVTARADTACTLARDLVDAFRSHPAVPPVRVGLAAGHVAALRGDFFGRPVHLAARIVGIAPPSTVLVSREVRERTVDAPHLAFVPAEPAALAGFERPVELFRLERA
jgi:class 3 adenylate cyclase